MSFMRKTLINRQSLRLHYAIPYKMSSAAFIEKVPDSDYRLLKSFPPK